MIVCVFQDRLEPLLEKDLAVLCRYRKIGLVIIDSVAGVFRSLSDDWILRARAMRRFKYLITRLQDQHRFAVVCVNQVTSIITDYLNPTVSSLSSDIKPCLGPIWTNIVATRLLLTKQTRHHSRPSVRTLTVEFSPFGCKRSAQFILQRQGVAGTPVIQSA